SQCRAGFARAARTRPRSRRARLPSLGRARLLRFRPSRSRWPRWDGRSTSWLAPRAPSGCGTRSRAQFRVPGSSARPASPCSDPRPSRCARALHAAKSRALDSGSPGSPRFSSILWRRTRRRGSLTRALPATAEAATSQGSLSYVFESKGRKSVGLALRTRWSGRDRSRRTLVHGHEVALVIARVDLARTSDLLILVE